MTLLVDYDTILSMTPEWNFDSFVEMLPNEGFLLEIGSFVGKSTVCWAKTFDKYNKEWDIHTVDAFAGQAPPSLYTSDESVIEYMKPFVMSADDQMSQFLKNIEGYDNITWEKRWISDGYVPPVKPTAMFYDGDHNYKGMKAVFDCLGDTPYIFVDDCTPMFPQSIQVLDELNRNYNINENGIGVVHG